MENEISDIAALIITNAPLKENNAEKNCETQYLHENENKTEFNQPSGFVIPEDEAR